MDVATKRYKASIEILSDTEIVIARTFDAPRDLVFEAITKPEHVTPPSRLVSTENYEPIGPGHEMIATITLEERGGRTLFKNRLAYPSKADRDGHLGSGMERGMNESLDRLEGLVTSR